MVRKFNAGELRKNMKPAIYACSNSRIKRRIAFYGGLEKQRSYTRLFDRQCAKLLMIRYRKVTMNKR